MGNGGSPLARPPSATAHHGRQLPSTCASDWLGLACRINLLSPHGRATDVIDRNRGKAKGRISLRRSQLRILEHGSAAMGIFLGKQYLGQRDQLDIAAPQIVAIVIPNGAPPDPQNAVPDPDDVVEIKPVQPRQLT